MPVIKASDYNFSTQINVATTISDVEEKVNNESRNLKKYIRKQIAISRWRHLTK